MSSTAAGTEALTERTLRAFRADEHVRERLDGVVLNIDRQLPYLFIYRQPQDRADPGTERLILGEASYLIVEGTSDRVRSTVHALAETATAELGSFLLLEVWSGEPGSNSFVVHAPAGPAPAVVNALRRGLDALQTGHHETSVVVRAGDDRHPPGMLPLLDTHTCWQIGCLLIGLEVPPLFRDSETGEVYPVFLRQLRALLSPVLRQAAYEFARVETTASFESYHAVGPRRLDRAAADADRELAAIERSYALLLLVAPVNSRAAWLEFRDGGYRRSPTFRYRLLPVDPDVLKRRLFNVDLAPVADPAVAFLLHDKRDELDRQITLIAERGTAGFRYASMRLFGVVTEQLLQVAHDILATVPPSRMPPRSDVVVNAAEFAALARAEIDRYRAVLPDLAADVQVRPDLVGLMVSRGDLLIGEGLALRPARVPALLHHEIGTHVLTYYNGRAQPLRQLATGLAGYDELQEGIAVFGEYLVGGLDAARMRVLAGRVIAAHCVEQGAGFMETFGSLHRTHGFSAGSAFDITERVHQSGGFTRDLIYLRGLLELTKYIRDGGDLRALYVGKIAAKHVEIIEELQARGFLLPAPLVPRVFELPDTQDRITAVRNGLPLTGLISDIV
ncbi:MAG: tyrosine/phenylalanine carboxypeptidase domain-containing protein [Gemmatimonadota bacterium]